MNEISSCIRKLKYKIEKEFEVGVVASLNSCLMNYDKKYLKDILYIK